MIILNFSCVKRYDFDFTAFPILLITFKAYYLFLITNVYKDYFKNLSLNSKYKGETKSLFISLCTYKSAKITLYKLKK